MSNTEILSNIEVIARMTRRQAGVAVAVARERPTVLNWRITRSLNEAAELVEGVSRVVGQQELEQFMRTTS